MTYYVVVDRCPSCNSLQKRWVVPLYKQESLITCVECNDKFLDNSNIYQIIADNVSVRSKTVSIIT